MTRLRPPALRAVAIVLASCVVYLPALGAGFIWDDDALLYAQPLVHAADGLYRFWFTSESLMYYPVTNTSRWLEWRLFGMDPLGYHLIGVGLHAATSLLLWRVLLRLAVPGAWLIALVFAVHPVNAASVMWISQRKNGLALLFAALSALAFLRSQDESSRRWLALSLLAFALAMLSKTSVAGLPVVLLGFVWWRRDRIAVADLRRVLPYFALSGVLSVVTVYFQYSNSIPADLHPIVRPEGFASRLAALGWVVWFYVGKALWPVDLVMIYPRWDVRAGETLHWAPLALLALTLAGAWWARERGGRAVLFGLGSLVVLVLPVAGFFKIYHQRFSLVADQYQYTAIIATLALAIGSAMRLWPWRGVTGRRAGALLATLLVGALSLLCFRHALDFRSDLLLFAQNARVHPDSHGAQYHLGLALARKGDLEGAMQAYRRAIELRPLYGEAHYNLAELERVQGRLPRALHHYEQAALRESLAARAYYGQGQVYEALSNRDEARARYERALEADPRNALAREALERLSRPG